MMKLDHIMSRFNDDSRAVTQVLGFILLFGILTIAFTSYQAQIVPQQNAETEFEHFQENQDDLVDLRSSILTAGTSDRAQYPTVELGTNYRTRILALNGPPPAGTLQTTESYPITISDESDSVTVDTRFIEYQPGYSELGVGSTWYENSVLYSEEGPTDAERVFIENQSLVDSGRLQITALQNEFQQTSTDRVTVELRTLEDETVGDLSDLDKSDDLTVEMPTRLNRSYWDDQLSDSEVVFNVGESTLGHFDSDVNRQNLTVDNVTVNSVGIRDAPDDNPQKDIDPITGISSSTDTTRENGDSTFESLEFTPQGNLNNVVITWENVENSEANEIEFTVEDEDGDTDDATEDASFGGTAETQIGTGGSPETIVVTAEVFNDENDLIETCESEQITDGESRTINDGITCEL